MKTTQKYILEIKGENTEDMPDDISLDLQLELENLLLCKGLYVSVKKKGFFKKLRRKI